MIFAWAVVTVMAVDVFLNTIYHICPRVLPRRIKKEMDKAYGREN